MTEVKSLTKLQIGNLRDQRHKPVFFAIFVEGKLTVVDPENVVVWGPASKEPRDG